MFRWALRKGIDKFERESTCDASPIRDEIDSSPRAAWLALRVTHLFAAAALVVGLAAPAAGQVSDQPSAVSGYTLTPERIAASGAAVVALIGAVIGGLALARSAGQIGRGKGRRGAVVALVLGSIALVVGGLVVATAAVVSAPATGSPGA